MRWFLSLSYSLALTVCLSFHYPGFPPIPLLQSRGSKLSKEDASSCHIIHTWPRQGWNKKPSEHIHPNIYYRTHEAVTSHMTHGISMRKRDRHVRVKNKGRNERRRRKKNKVNARQMTEREREREKEKEKESQ